MQRSYFRLLSVLTALLGVTQLASAGYDQTFRLTHPDGALSDAMGTAVAIDGNIALVGVQQDDDYGYNSGSALLFDTTTGNLIAKLTSDDTTAYTAFGGAVAIDNGIAVVGVSKNSHSGGAYLFDATDGSFLAKLLPDGAGLFDGFGSSVSIQDDTVIVGAWEDRSNGTQSGSAYVFDISDPINPTQTFQLFPDDVQIGHEFGWSVDQSGTTAIISAPGDSTQFQEAGSVYFFDTVSGEQLAKVTADEVVQYARFGASVAISDDRAIVSNRGHVAHLFDTTDFQQILKVDVDDGPSGFGSIDPVDIDGDLAIIGVPGESTGFDNSGAVYVIDLTTGDTVEKIKHEDLSAQHALGASVSLSGTNILAGAPNHGSAGSLKGAAYLFDMDQLTPEPGSNPLIELQNIPEDTQTTHDDVVTIANTGGIATEVYVYWYQFTGPDAGLFDLVDFDRTTLVGGGLEQVWFDLSLAAVQAGDYSAILTLYTDEGNVDYVINANVIPEPTVTVLLACGMLGLCRRQYNRVASIM